MIIDQGNDFLKLITHAVATFWFISCETFPQTDEKMTRWPVPSANIIESFYIALNSLLCSFEGRYDLFVDSFNIVFYLPEI